MEKLKEVGVLMWILLAAFYIFFMALPDLAHADDNSCRFQAPDLEDATIFIEARCESNSIRIDDMIQNVEQSPVTLQVKFIGLTANKNLTFTQKSRLKAINTSGMTERIQYYASLKLGEITANAE